MKTVSRRFDSKTVRFRDRAMVFDNILLFLSCTFASCIPFSDHVFIILSIFMLSLYFINKCFITKSAKQIDVYMHFLEHFVTVLGIGRSQSCVTSGILILLMVVAVLCNVKMNLFPLHHWTPLFVYMSFLIVMVNIVNIRVMRYQHLFPWVVKRRRQQQKRKRPIPKRPVNYEQRLLDIRALDLPDNFDALLLRKHWLRIARKHHPDVSDNPQSNDIFIRSHHAYQRLLHETKAITF